MMTAEEFKAMTDEELQTKIINLRAALALLDNSFVAIREVGGQVTTDDLPNMSMNARCELDLAQREQAKRGNQEYGVFWED